MGFDIILNNLHFSATFLLFSGFVVLCLFGFIGNININADGNNISISGDGAEKDLVNEQFETISSCDATKIQINNPVGSVKVFSGNEDKVSVVRKLYLPKATPVDEKAKIIDIFMHSVFSKHEEVLELNIPKMSVMEMMTASVDLEVSIPVQYNVKVIPAINSINIDKIDGSVDVSSKVGNVDLNDLAGKVNVHTNSGNIYLKNVKNISSVDSNVGDIVIKSSNLSQGEIGIHANTGKIDAEFQEVYPTTNATFTVNAGDLKVSLSKNCNANIHLQTNMGQVFLDPSLKIVADNKQFMGESVDAILNNGGGKLKLESKMGKLQISLH